MTSFRNMTSVLQHLCFLVELLSSGGPGSDGPSLFVHIIGELWESKCNNIDNAQLELGH